MPQYAIKKNKKRIQFWFNFNLNESEVLHWKRWIQQLVKILWLAKRHWSKRDDITLGLRFYHSYKELDFFRPAYVRKRTKTDFESHSVHVFMTSITRNHKTRSGAKITGRFERRWNYYVASLHSFCILNRWPMTIAQQQQVNVSVNLKTTYALAHVR